MKIKGLEQIFAKRILFPSTEGQSIFSSRTGQIRLQQRGLPTNPCVVLIPDPPNILESLEPLIHNLSADYFVIAFEAPGFGFSRASQDFDFTIDQQAQLIIEILEFKKIPKATLAVTCISGLSALRAANLRPDLIQALVLGQSAELSEAQKWAKRSDIKGLIATPIIGQILLGGWPKKISKLWVDAALARGKDRTELLKPIEKVYDQGACFCLASAFQGLLSEKNLSENFKTSKPVTLLWGLKDRSHRRTDYKKLQSLLPQLQIHELTDCGHFPDIENANDFAQAVRST